MSSEDGLPDTLALLLKILQMTGCWQPETASASVIGVYRIYRITIFLASFFSLFAAQIVYIIKVINNLEKLTDAMFLPLTYVGITIKISNFIYMKNRVRSLIANIKREIFQPKNERQQEMLAKRMTEFKITYIVFMSMATATIILWAVFPLLEKSYANNNQKTLPVAAWYPFNFQNSPLYEIVYIHQIAAIFINALANITLDCLIPGLMSFICAQLEFLNDSLENIKKKGNSKIELTIAIKRSEYAENVDIKLFKQIERALARCVSHHCNILSLCTEINSMFSVATLAQLSVSIFTICFTMFQLTLVSPYTIQFWSMVLYQGCMLMELFLFCWYGNEVLLKSTQLLTSVYNSDWINCPNWLKRHMLIIMIRAHRPISMYAGNFFFLSLTTFVMILRTSWSYFAVLQKVHSK